MEGYIDYENVKREIHDYCDMAPVNTFDEDGILCDILDIALLNNTYIQTIDDLSPETWDSLLKAHDNA